MTLEQLKAFDTLLFFSAHARSIIGTLEDLAVSALKAMDTLEQHGSHCADYPLLQARQHLARAAEQIEIFTKRQLKQARQCQTPPTT